MNPVNVFLIAMGLAFSAKTGAWLLQLKLRNAGLVDAIWAWTLGGLAVVYAALGSGPLAPRVAVALMGGAWGLRLGTHLWRRNVGKPEDWRYARFRQEWGAHADRNMFWFFQFQNLFTLALSASAFMPVVFRTDAPAPICYGLAVLIWMLAVVGEGVADAQMERFRADPALRGQVCDRGLWRYSRHPNYFFECVHWAAYVPLALGAPWGWASLLAPLLMATLLLKLSGVPLLEAEMIRRKPGYADYVRRTSRLIPLPPRSAVPTN
jgi:steroid 5-alpha reductase family enzyme